MHTLCRTLPLLAYFSLTVPLSAAAPVTVVTLFNSLPETVLTVAGFSRYRITPAGGNAWKTLSAADRREQERMGGYAHPAVTVDRTLGTILIDQDRIGTTSVTTRAAWFSRIAGDPLLAVFAETMQGGTGVRRTRFALFRRSGGVWREVTRRLLPNPSLEDFFAKPAPGELPLPLAYDQGTAEAFPRFAGFSPAASRITLTVVPSYLPPLLSPDDADAVARFEAAPRLRLVYQWERSAAVFRLLRKEPLPEDE